MKLDNTWLIVDAEKAVQSTSELRIGAIEPWSMVAGPGPRAVIWVTGCNRRCPGCIKPEFLDFKSGKLLRIDVVEKTILDLKNISGVTFSGGEPFEQSIGLAELSRRLKSNGLDVLVYTGYTLASLIAEPKRFGPLLEQVDWLIDGEFRIEQAGPIQYMGSMNQQLLKKQADGSWHRVQTADRHEIQVSFRDSAIRMTGFPDRKTEREFSKSLEKRGIIMQPIATTQSE